MPKCFRKSTIFQLFIYIDIHILIFMQNNHKEKRLCSFYLPFHHKNVSQQSLCMYFKVFLPNKMQQVKLFFIAVFMVSWRKNNFEFMGSSTLCFKSCWYPLSMSVHVSIWAMLVFKRIAISIFCFRNILNYR